jgi:hypothetical protein
MKRTTKRSELEWSLPQWKKPTKVHEYGSEIVDYLETTRKLNICEISTESVHTKFKRLLAEWKEQTAHMSYATTAAMLPSYQQIIGMGEPVLPFILKELKERPAHLFWALRAISGADPVPAEDRGHIDKMIKAWIKWGRQKKII